MWKNRDDYRKYHREWKRTWRKNLSPEEKACYYKKLSTWRKKRLALRTPDEIIESKTKNRERHKKRRDSMTPTEKVQEKEKFRFWGRVHRLRLTEEERKEQNKKLREYRQNMSPEKKFRRKLVSKAGDINCRAKRIKMPGKVFLNDLLKLYTNPKCSHLGCQQTTALCVDHIIPACFGGKNIGQNLQLLCQKHHLEKTSGEIIELRETKIRCELTQERIKQEKTSIIQLKLF